MIRIDETATANRDQQIRDALLNPYCYVPPQYAGIRCSFGQHKGILYVSSDAYSIKAVWEATHYRECDGQKGVLYVPENDEEAASCTSIVRVNVTATSAQQIADATGMLLPTTKIADMIWQQCAVKLPPYTDTPDARMADTSRMFKHSNRVESGKAGRQGLTCNVGKHWVLTNGLLSHPGCGANYGWYDSSAPNIAADGKTRLWQSLGFAHNLAHVDYSQTLTLVSPHMIVDEQQMLVADVMVNPELCGLISYEGPLKITRYPGVPFYDPAGMKQEASVKVVCSEQARRTMTTVPETVPAPPPSGVAKENGIKFMKARYFTAVPDSRPRDVQLVVLHVMQVPEKPKMAAAVGAYFQSEMIGADGKPRPASTHYGVDAEETVQYVREQDVAYGASGANHNGIHVEHAGYSEQDAKGWDDEYSRKELERSAILVAGICSRHGIPVVFLTAEDLLVGTPKGITTHAQITLACALAKKRGQKDSPYFKATGTHTDPGKHFPMEWYLDRVRASL